jgi:plasmid stability protein
MTIMASHSSATVREQEPHVNQTTRTNTIINALKHRAQAVLNDRSIDAESRAIIRYALETNDPWLAQLVRRADAGETIIDNIEVLHIGEDVSSEGKIEALAEIVCRAGDEAGTKSAALLVLMATLENSTHPKALANMAKHVAFTRCGELNLNGMVEAQIAVLEGELLTGYTVPY